MVKLHADEANIDAGWWPRSTSAGTHATFEPENLQAKPTKAQMLEASRPFYRRDLLGQDRNTLMLVINGADDVHVPGEDTLVFDGRRDTEVHLIRGTGHVAASKLPEVLPTITRWPHNRWLPSASRDARQGFGAVPGRLSAATALDDVHRYETGRTGSGREDRLDCAGPHALRGRSL
ncbi:MAG TPA: hypothetical protein VJ914_22375 [Pseudonocardiaceae bacterium]|nr:hypothetical protein [Pseudonocardiaceae bacterium]